MAIGLSAIFTSIYGLIGLFLVLISASFLPIPDLSILVVSYASFTTSFKGLIFLIILVFIASIIGDLSVYFITKKFSLKINDKLKKYGWYNKHEEKSRSLLNKYEFIFVFFSRFIGTGVGAIVNYLSGFEKLNTRKFVLAVISGEAIYSIGYPLIGYIFKDTWKDVITFVQYGLISIILVAVAIYLSFKIIKFYHNKKAKSLIS